MSTTTDPTPVRPLPWASRIAGMPYLPGGGSGQLESLKKVLTYIEVEDGLLNAEVDLGGSVRTLKSAVQQLLPSGLIDRVNAERIDLSQSARSWLSTGDRWQLLAAFHRHIRFIGELLHEMDSAAVSTQQLNALANERYALAWSTLDQVRRRLYWLSAMGYTEASTSKLWALTDAGREALPLLVPGSPSAVTAATASPQAPVAVPAAPARIAALLDGLDASSLSRRSPVLGYIPRGNASLDAAGALERLVTSAMPAISRRDLKQLCADVFGTSEGSFGAILTTLTKCGLLRETGISVYSSTPEAAEWIETQETLNLVRILHAHLQFVLEIVPALDVVDQAPALADYGVKHLGLLRTDVAGVRSRLQLLKSAGLIEEFTSRRYQATALGEEVAAQVVLSAPPP